jgi:hypothetical protein
MSRSLRSRRQAKKGAGQAPRRSLRSRLRRVGWIPAFRDDGAAPTAVVEADCRGSPAPFGLGQSLYGCPPRLRHYTGRKNECVPPDQLGTGRKLL